MDKIIIKGLKIMAFHGVNPEEKRDGQNFVLDITANLDAAVPRVSDNVEDTVSYAKIIKIVTATFTKDSFDLIERAADEMCRVILHNFTKIESVTVLLKKPEAPIKADFEYVAVEISMSRKDLREGANT